MATVGHKLSGPNKEDNKPEYTYRDSFRHWWKRSSLEESEEQVLSLLPFYPESDGRREGKIYNVPIDSKNNVHEFNVKNIEARAGKEDHVVLIHGYGAALGFFYNNFDSLTERPGINLHALDLLGYGLSSRPKFPKQIQKNTVEDVEKVKTFSLKVLKSGELLKRLISSI
jgi:cardiolipin-specific phospholipase